MCGSGAPNRVGIDPRRIATGLLLAALVLLGAPGPIALAQDSGSEHGFLARVDQERQARSLPPYAHRSDLQAVARRHLQRMIEHGAPYHNPHLASEVGGDWSLTGENVGVGETVDGLHTALMDSPTHRENLLTRGFSEIGVAAARSVDGRLWVVQVFRQPREVAVAVAPPPTNPAPAPTVLAAPVEEAPAPAPSTVAPAPPSTTAAPLPPAQSPPAPVGEVLSAGLRSLPAWPSGPTLPAEVPQPVPTAAAVAAGLLAAVVALQGETLRRLGLVRLR